MIREFRVWRAQRPHPFQPGAFQTRFFVDDSTDLEALLGDTRRPPTAVFPVSPAHAEDAQFERAALLCAVLNGELKTFHPAPPRSRDPDAPSLHELLSPSEASPDPILRPPSDALRESALLAHSLIERARASALGEPPPTAPAP